MAFTPCAAHGKGYAGAASTFFLRLVEGANVTGGKIQTCADCATVVMDNLADHFQMVSEGEDFYDLQEVISCSLCGGDLPTHHVQFYGNAYPRGSRESQWYGRVCPDCVGTTTELLHLDKAQVRR